MKKRILWICFLSLSFLLFGCQQGPWLDSTTFNLPSKIKVEKSKTKQTGKLFTLDFLESFQGNASSSLNFPQSELIESYNNYNCSIGKCGYNTVLSKDSPDHDKLYELLSGQKFNLIEYILLQESSTDEIKIEQFGADFEFLTDVEYEVEDGVLTIQEPKKYFPIILQLNSSHDIDGRWRREHSVIAIKGMMLAPRYYAVESDLKSELEEKNIYLDFKIPTYQIKNFPETIHLTQNIRDRQKKELTLTFKGYERQNTPELEMELTPHRSAKISSKRDGDDLVVNLKDLGKSTNYKLKLTLEEDECELNYTVGFMTLDDFKAVTNKQSKSENWFTNEYTLCFSHEVVDESFENAMIAAFGSGNYITTDDDEYYDYGDGYGYGYDGGQDCHTFIYFSDPKIRQTIKLDDLKSEYGDTLSVEFRLEPHVIPDSQKYLKLVGTPVTIIPKYGEFGKKIQVIHKNKSEGEIFYRDCSFLKDYSDGIKQNFKIQDEYQEAIDDYYYYLPNYLTHKFMWCGPTQSIKLEFEYNKPRKEYVHEIALEDLFGENIPDAFEFGLYDFNSKRGLIYIRSDIGLIAKASNQTLHAWAHSLDTGKPISGAKYMVGRYDQESNTFVTEYGDLNNNYLYHTFEQRVDLGFVYIYTDDDANFLLFPRNNFNAPDDLDPEYSYYNNSFGLDLYDIGGSAYRSEPNQYKMYAFTDRVLYKPGSEEDIFVSGWIRKPGKSTLPVGRLEIEFYDPNGQVIEEWSTSDFDEFGGFKTSFQISKDAKLGSYRISYRYDSDTEQDLRYDTYIQVQEYKKPNISLDAEIITDDKKTIMRVSPQYYFGQALQSYDIQLSYSIAPKTRGYRDRWRCGDQWCDHPIYYNSLEGYREGSWGLLSVDDYEGTYFDLDLTLPNKSFANFHLDMTITDHETKEVVHKSINQEISPQYLVGIEGRKYDRHRINGDEKFVLEGQIMEKIRADQDRLENYDISNDGGKVKIVVYYRDFNRHQSRGPDGEYYYVGGQEYEKVDELETSVRGGKYDKEIIFDKQGSYVLRVFYDDIYENNKRVSVYDYKNCWWYRHGDMNNNYKLEVMTKDKEYSIGEEVEVNIEPYIEGATAILTVEKDAQILYQKELVLDWNPLNFEVQKDRYPNVHVSVAQIAGEQLNVDMSERPEPRFRIGYSQVNLSPKMMAVNFDIDLTNLDWQEQDYYYPGQRMKFSIKSTDYEWNPIKTRMSVGIVDKALIDIYDQIREPLKNFYTSSRPGFYVLANYHILFKALKVFSADGSKGGGWGEDDGMDPLAPRKKFMDLAFRRWGEVSDTNWYFTFETELPDNLTTWVIDVIWLGESGEMGTKRQYFTVSKDVIMNVYMPRFISPYSMVRIPLSVITNKDELKDIKIVWNIQVGDYSKELAIKKDGDDHYFDLSIDEIPLEVLLENDNLQVFVQAGSYDAVQYSLPIRKENMIINEFSSYEYKEVQEIIPLGSKAQHALIKVTVSTVPVQSLSNAVKYLLRYPYGCTEQLLSAMYPTLVAKSLADKGFLEYGLISGNKVNYQGKRNEIDQVIKDTLQKIYKNQTPKGLFGYRHGEQNGNVSLSIYVYHVLNFIQELGYDIEPSVLEKLEYGLKNFDDTSTQLYYLMQKATLGIYVNLQQVSELVKKDNTFQNKVMAYAIYAHQGQNAEQRYKDISKWLKNEKNTHYGYHLYGNKNILKSYFIRALVQNEMFEEASTWVKDLNKLVDRNGRRGWSTQENMQIILALSDYIQARIQHEGTISAQVSINGDTQTAEIGAYEDDAEKFVSYQTLERTLKNLEQIDFDFSADQELITTLAIEYIPENVDAFVNKGEGVTTMNMGAITLENLNEAEVGAIISMTGEFETSQDANQIAVVYTIPPYTYIMNQIGQNGSRYDCRWCYYSYYGGSSNKATNQISFTTKKRTDSGRYSCNPNHYEIRYDRLFLYYNKLPSGAACEVNFSLMKTHNWVANMLNHSLFEMYGTDVWWSEFTL